MKMTDKEKIKNDDMDVSRYKERIWSIGLINITIKIKDQKAEEVEDYSKALADKSKECEDLKTAKIALMEVYVKRLRAWANCKKALDEIEKRCCAVLNGNEKILYAYQIKDIINKAKEENDEKM